MKEEETINHIQCHRLTKRFGPNLVVNSLSFQLKTGTILALLGPSGCGKTTILRLIAGFEQLDEGEIDIAGKRVSDNWRHLPPEKRRVGMVFQDYAIFPHMNILENVRFGLPNTADGKRRAHEMLEIVGLAELDQRMPQELSGGQQQRVALARALAPEPEILLFDEPFSNLDAALRLNVRQEVKQLLKKNNMTAIFVTHDQEEALFMGDLVGVMNNGRLEQIDTPEQIFLNPKTRFVADFVGQTDFINGTTSTFGIDTILGTLSQPVDLPPNTEIEVAIRADDVQFITADEGKGNGHIYHRHFTGIANIYQIKLTNGQIIHSWQPHTMIIKEHTPVKVWLSEAHPVPCFHEGVAVTDFF